MVLWGHEVRRGEVKGKGNKLNKLYRYTVYLYKYVTMNSTIVYNYKATINKIDMSKNSFFVSVTNLSLKNDN